MPELPEVETTRRGLAPHVEGRVIAQVTVREPRLRWPVAADLPGQLAGQPVGRLGRRAKYLLLPTPAGTLIAHLGMSGSLRILHSFDPPGRHDHVDIGFTDGSLLRFNDPRRFGSLHFAADPTRHPLLAGLGPEPLDAGFDGAYLWQRARKRRVAIKPWLMNARIVAGVGNIYANEALYRAGIHPQRAAGRVSRQRMDALAEAVRDVLSEAIAAGGTTLRDFVGGDGRPGYFRIRLRVYDRGDQPCERCGAVIRQRAQAQRATYYCARCQR